MTLPVGHKHTHTIVRGGMFRKDKPTKCDYCETESYWREQIAQEIEVDKCDGNKGCFGVNGEHCDVLDDCAKIARGEVNNGYQNA